MHIAGVIVHSLPENVERIKASIASMEGAEIHGIDRGRIVVTVESSEYRRTSDMVLALHQVEGVLSAALVYQHGEDDIESE